MKIIDLTLLMEDGMPTCGTSWHETVKITPMGTLEEVGRNTHSLTFGSHTGTHMDAPAHFMSGGKTIEHLDLDKICGEVQILDYSHKQQGTMITMEDLENIHVTPRMLFRFGWYKHWKTEQYYKEFPCFSKEAMIFLLEGGLEVLALDTPSPDGFQGIASRTDSENHKILLEKNVVIIEYLTNTFQLDLDKKYDLIALPLKIQGSDGSPSRVIAIERDGKTEV